MSRLTHMLQATKRTASRAVMLLAGTFIATGCSDDYWVHFEYISDAPKSVLIDRDQIEVPAGFAVGVEAIPVEDDKRGADELDMVAERPGIIGIDRSLEDDQWVFYGISPGTTQVELWFDNKLVGEIPANVVEQLAP